MCPSQSILSDKLFKRIADDWKTNRISWAIALHRLCDIGWSVEQAARWLAVTCLVLCVASSASAQSRTFTNADLGQPITHAPAAPAVYVALQAHAYQPIPTPARGPVFASTGATAPSAGPWVWPVPAPARRLDGTLLDAPVTIYGGRLARRFRR